MAAAIPTKLISKEIVSSSHLVGVSYTEGGHDSPRSSSSQRNALDEFSLEFILPGNGSEGKPLSVFAVSFPFEKFWSVALNSPDIKADLITSAATRRLLLLLLQRMMMRRGDFAEADSECEPLCGKAANFLPP